MGFVGAFCCHCKFKVQVMLANFATGRQLRGAQKRNRDILLREHLPSVMPPSTEAHGFLHWSTLVGVTDEGLTELNSALICI